MKKLLAGCLVILVLGIGVLVVGGFWLYNVASPVIESARASVATLSALDDLHGKIRNTATFTPPSSGELTEAQVRRFVQVQDHVRAALGRRVDEIERKYEHLTRDGIAPGIAEMATALGDLTDAFVDARRHHIDALNEQLFSEDEYAWVRARIFQAAGVEAGSQFDWRAIEDALRRGGLDDIRRPELPKIEIPERNRALVKPYLDKAKEWLPLAAFGL